MPFVKDVKPIIINTYDKYEETSDPFESLLQLGKEDALFFIKLFLPVGRDPESYIRDVLEGKAEE